MKRSLTAPSRAQQAKRDKLQRFKQLPTSWWSALRGYLKKLKRATRKSSASCQTPVRPPPHQSAPIRSHNQKIYPKQQLWQRLQGPSTDSNSTLEANITPSFFQPSMNFSLRRSPAIPAGWYSFTRRGFTTLSINRQNPKVSHISFRVTDINSLFRSLQPLPLMIPTCVIACSFSPLPESQHDQKQAALVYLPKQINHLPPLLPIINEVDRLPLPLDSGWQWPTNKFQVIDPVVKITNPSPEGSTVKETEPEKITQKESKFKLLKSEKMPHILWPKQQPRKRRHPYSGSELTEPPKKRAKLASNLDSNEKKARLIESEDEAIYPFIEMINPSLEELTEREEKPKQPTQKKSQTTKFKIAYCFDVSKTFSSSELLEPPKKHDKVVAFDLDEARLSLIESEDKDVYPFVEIKNPSSKGSDVQQSEPEKLTQKESKNNIFKKAVFFKTSKTKYQETRKCCRLNSGSELPEPPKKHARLDKPSPDETELSLIESENKDESSIECDDYENKTISEKTDNSTEKWSGSELSKSDPSETETATEDEDAWCYRLAAYGYDTQRYPLLTQLPDDCHWGKRIIRDFEPEDIFWLDFEEKSLLYGARQCAVLTEFFQIDPLTYQHPYLEQSINAYTTPSESLSSPTQVDSCSPADSTFKNINLTDSLLIGGS